ncbi:tetratricopeptide repeat protein [Croceicoccus sediminis]|uniref:tetratricopeptide repeat protein n=1 Tax=Croceicoccus sediminis TaxID=2571150 RepID=UPI00118202FE|nr:hypothetical protein [Croceicoccus sediminis]
MHRIHGFLLSATAALGLASPAAAEWHKAETENFIVYSEGKEDRVRAFARELELFDALLHQLHGIERSGNPNRPTIYLVDSSRDVEKLSWSGVGGFYTANEYGTYAVGRNSRIKTGYRLNGNSILYHEYAHHFMYRNFNSAVPAWYSEAFAEFYSTTVIGDDTIEIGRPANHRTYSLQYHDGDSVAEFLLAEQGDNTSYSRGWLLLHMLQSDPGYAHRLATYLDDFRNGKSLEEAAKALGDLDRLTDAVGHYGRGKLQFSILDTTNLPAPAITTSLPDPVEQELISIDLLRRSEMRQDEPIRLLKKLEQKYPGEPRVKFALAKAHHDHATFVDEIYEYVEELRRTLAEEEPKSEKIEDLEEAIAYNIKEYDLADKAKLRAEQARAYADAEREVDVVLAAMPDHPRANALKGEILMHKAAKGEDDQWRAARGYLVKANRLSPEDPLPLYLWHKAYRDSGDEMPEVAHMGLRKAYVLAPESKKIRNALARDLADLGQFEPAIAIAKISAFSPHAWTTDRKLLEDIRKMAKLPRS